MSLTVMIHLHQHLQVRNKDKKKELYVLYVNLETVEHIRNIITFVLLGSRKYFINELKT